MSNLKLTDSLGLPAPCHPLSQQNGQNHNNISGLKPSIISLHDDILWQIFLLNADMVDESEDKDAVAAIDTLRYSSQVCSKWRQIILSFSSLWGQVINFSRLEDDDWREEVLRRTGRSLLSVFWGPPSQASLCEVSVTEILKHHWDRIRWLELDVTNHDFGSDYSIKQFWKVFQRPSKVLETFRVFFDRTDRKPVDIISPSNFVIFNNTAPALRVFCAPNMRFKLDAPWLANLRFLALTGQVSAYDVIRAIPHMPLLECLTDETSNAIACNGVGLPSLPQITPSSIKKLILSSSSDIGPYINLLSQIKPAAGCYLDFSHTRLTFDAEMLTLADRVLYSYSRCCDLPSANDISFELHRYQFNFEAHIPGEGQFRFKLIYYTKLPRDIIKALFAALPSVNFQHVKTLTLGISPTTFKPNNRRITEFILSVPSVETLTVNPKTLRFLLNIPTDNFALSFPLLHTVEISSYLRGEGLSTIKEFLTSRISSGRPVEVLSLPINLDARTDLRSLEEFTGLTIILQCDGQEYEHICGDGRIDDLLFT
ncbi:hypothetical protein GALMADRAFT_136327 [Galerina marginata CBS 339.88]|uniref:F-box domain-containing protein n=1 Tax=Galerina marginata (strain CBS 339.88) TaxID=685588 RepID=A0A067TQR9_GALM3|nr:hypothetical protein GALMADRAFT_136327 [Galerina marginata CBS 339.88]